MCWLFFAEGPGGDNDDTAGYANQQVFHCVEDPHLQAQAPKSVDQKFVDFPITGDGAYKSDKNNCADNVVFDGDEFNFFHVIDKQYGACGHGHSAHKVHGNIKMRDG